MTTVPFRDLPLSEDTLASIAAVGFENATPVQAQGIPALLTGKDTVLQAQTGTGKTAAFVLPIVEMLAANSGTVEALVLAPTRELALQVSREFASLGDQRGIIATAIYGGTSFEKQYEALETAQVVVATPGRLLDLLRREKIDLDHVKIFGLDEADEMLSMGFEREVLDVVSHLPDEKQSFLCSATVSDPIQRVASAFMKDPVTVNCSTDAIGARSIEHQYFRVPFGGKVEALSRIIEARSIEGAIIFCNTRAETFRVTEALKRQGRAVDVINGDLSQNEREKALKRMRGDNVSFLVATDVAARGIDISGLPAVVNYDMPKSPEVYVHRTGRTGRAGQFGVAFSLVTPSDITVFHALHKYFKLHLREQPMPTMAQVRASQADRAVNEVLSDLDAAGTLAYAQYLAIARRLGDRDDGARIIARLIAHYVGTAPMTVEDRTTTDAKPAPAPVEEVAEVEEAPVAAAPEPVEVEPVAEPEPEPEVEEVVEAAVEDEVEAEAPAAPATDGENAVLAWFIENTTPRNRVRFRGGRRIAEALDLSQDEVEQIADATPELERGRGRRPMWRLFKDAAARLLPDVDAAHEPDRGRDDAPQQAAPKKDEPKKAAPTKDEPKKQEEPKKAAPKKAAPKKDEPKQDDAPRSGRGSRSRGGDRDRSRSSRPAPRRRGKGYVQVRVNLGEGQVGTAERLTEVLSLLAGLDGDDFGTIEVKGDHSFVEIRDRYANDTVNALDGESVDGVRLSLEIVQG